MSLMSILFFPPAAVLDYVASPIILFGDLLYLRALAQAIAQSGVVQ